MNATKQTQILRTILSATIAVALAAPASALAYANRVTFTGQGLEGDGFGGYDLQTETCGIANGAEVDGPYVLFVVTATGAKNADITGPWGTAPMSKYGNGTFKFVAPWYEPNALLAFGVSATYDGKVKNAQLVVSHGCRPYTHGAWCSPGFWKKAEQKAWDLTGHARTDPFNLTVFDYFYGDTYGADPTLGDVLGAPSIYSGAPFAGTSGYNLNAFNATGAFLTNNIPGYSFSMDAMLQNNDSATCPIDHHGNWKVQQ